MQPALTSIRAEPNVTPMIDVMLVLLIIFMVVTPLLVVGFHAEPPGGVHLTAHPDEPADVVIGIDEAGRYYLDTQPVSEATLEQRLAQRFRSGTDDRVVYVRADRSTRYARIAAVLDLAAKAGAREVGLVSALPATERERRTTP